MSASFTLRVYGLVAWLVQPLLRRKLRRRAVAEPGYGQAMEERFGHYASDLKGIGWCWIHAVSLGEARAAGILIDALRCAAPELRVLLTHGTATGRAEGAKLLRPGDLQIWQPWDSPGAVARFLDRFQPRIGVLMETEVWPQLTAACAARGIPLVLANARLNTKSLAGAQKFAWLARPAYAALAAVWTQSDADAQRLALLGAKVEGVFGNLKFDAAPEADQLALGRAWRAAQLQLTQQPVRPVLLLASSRDDEERQLLDLLRRQRDAAAGQAWAQADVQWLIVPRHPQRFDAVAALIEAAGFTVARRSVSVKVSANVSGDVSASAPALFNPAQVWLGDSLGEMALYYGLADVALLGGSFAPLGGQNLIEAAACGCPVVLGPSTFNFAEAATLALAAGAARRVVDMTQAVQTALSLVGVEGPPGSLGVPDAAEAATQRATMVRAALAFTSANRGAAQRTAAAVLALYRNPSDAVKHANATPSVHSADDAPSGG